jgi:adenine-specific DNA methylase
MAFVFQHRKEEAWSSVLKALLQSGFYVRAVYPTHGETESGVRAYGLSYNSLLVCKKLAERRKRQTPWTVFESELQSKVDAEIGRILVMHPELEIEDAFIIAMGKALEVYSQNYGNIIKDGEVFDVSEVSMEIIGDIVFDSLLKHLLEKVPDVDRLSKIYATVFAGREKATGDTINKLTRHGGIETDIFEEEKLLKKNKKKGIMVVVSPEEREGFILNKIEKGIPIAYIDGAHLLAVEVAKKGSIDRVLNTLLRAGLDKDKLERYIKFIDERVKGKDTVWTKINGSLQRPIFDLGK